MPHVIPGSKQYWISFGYDLIAMTEQLGIPDFLTLSPNNNWRLIYNPSSGKDGEPVQIPQNLKTYHANLMMNRQLALIL